MAADVAVPSGSSNPCCRELKRKYEEVKTSLKKALDLIEPQKKAIKEVKLKAKLEKEAKEKEIAVRKTLENDIHELKAQIASLSQETKTTGIADKSEDELKRVKQLLEEEKMRTHSEKKNATNAWDLLKLEKGKVEEERRLVQMERARANELSASIEKVKREFGESRGQLAKRVEEEKQKASREKRRADTEKAKLEEQKKYVEREKKKVVEEKSRADGLLKKLEEEREKNKDLLKKLEEEKKSNKGFKAKLAVSSSQNQKGGASVEKEDLNVKFLREKLKLRKSQLKYVKRILKLEKSKNNIIKQELSHLKQDLIQISSRFKVLDSHLNIGGTNDLAKVVLSLSKPVAPLMVTSDPRAFVGEGGAPHISRQSQSRPASGTSSESLPPNRQSYSYFSDKKLLMGPQDRERDTSVSSPLLQNQKNTGACTRSSLEALKVSRKRKRKASSDSKRKVKMQNVKNHLNSELVEFEKMVREGGVLKLLEFENEDLERKFRSAMEGFLSPNLPQIVPRGNVKSSEKRDIDHLVGKDEDVPLIPKFDGSDLKKSSNLMGTVRADKVCHGSQCLNENGNTSEGGHDKHSHYFMIVFSNLNENSIARIGGILKEISNEESSVPQTIDISSRVLQLASKSELIPEEKVYVICSLLASEICRVLMSHSTDVANVDFDDYISSFADKTCSVLSEELLHFLIENGLLENTTSLLMDFLIYKQVLAYKNGVFCSSIATKNQFISSCIIFASICAKANQIDLIRAAAYKTLLKGKSDISCALISTHVFANICGERLLGTNEPRLLENALCWVVCRIEKGGNENIGFAPCRQCSFGMEMAGAEGFVDLLLDEVEACTLLKNREQHFLCGQHCSTYMAGGNSLCYFTEIVSLLELVGNYMAWECAYSKVVLRLLKILDSCRYEEFSAAILVLIGQLSRSGVDEGGYDQIQLLELRDKLLSFIQTTEKIGFSLQFACVSALLNLIPLKFKQMLMGHDDAPSGKGQFDREISQVKSWYSGLSEEQKVAFQSLFMT